MSDVLNPIQNISYTNKDFQTIFPELLDLAKKLTSRWDPSISNESDPGVVLLKLNAIIADKLNYNIDKNVLECFPLSVTQEDNARKLFAQLGYRMKWYQSAITNISIKYDGQVDTTNSVQIPPFTMVSDANNSVVYSLIGSPDGVADDQFYVNPTTLPFTGDIVSIKAIEGVSIKYDINGTTTIKYNHLDNNNRIYFNSSNIAENGIFITNVGSNNYSSWEKKDNLITENLGNTYYSFGISEDGSACYIEFPQDAENIIKDGIEITYIKSTGLDGNISANTIEKFYNDVYLTDALGQTVVLNSDNTVINNYSSSTNGSNPETINSAYSNYKKVVGTFDVLVTLRDYINYILRSGLVSNCFVCDRTNDIQCVYSIMTYDNDLDTLQRVQETTKVEKILPSSSPNEPNTSYGVYEEEESLTAFDIKLYLLEHVQSMSNYYDYVQTFDMLSNNAQQTIKYYLEDKKCISHDYADILPISSNSAHICFFKNKYPIISRIYTKYALTQSQANDVISNIQKAFFKNLNASVVEFSEEITSDLVNQIILSADERIKSATIENIDYITYAVYWDGLQFNEVPISPIPEDVDYDPLREDPITLQIVYNASEYDSTIGYSIGDFCVYNGNRYICTQSIASPAGRFNPSKWELNSVTPKVDEEEFITAIGFNNYSTYEFLYNNYNWYLDGEEVDISGYGIDVYYTELDSQSTEQSSINYQNGDKLIVKVSIASQIKDEIFTKSVLAGVTPLYVKKEEFDYSFNQSYESIEENVMRISSNFNAIFTNASPTYTLRDNEYIQFYAPNLINGSTYSNYVKLEWNIASDIGPDEDYELKENEYVIFYWKDDNDATDIYRYYVYAQGNIIKPSFPMESKLGQCVGASLAAYSNLTQIADGIYVASTALNGTMSTAISDAVTNLVSRANILSGTKKVITRRINKLDLNSTYYCYWVLNDEVNGNYVLFEDESQSEQPSETQTYLLNSGEYFFYTNASLTELYIVGAGTTITRNSSTGTWSVPATINSEDILQNGTNALREVWVHPTYGQTITITENQYITVGPGSTIQLTRKDSSSTWSIQIDSDNNNSLSNYTVKYRSSATQDWTPLPDLTSDSASWNARSLLAINFGKNVYQRLLSNQSVTLTYDNSEKKQIYGTDVQILNSQGVVEGIPAYPVVLEANTQISFDGGGTHSVYSESYDGTYTYSKIYQYSQFTTSLNKIYRVTNVGDIILTFNPGVSTLSIPFSLPVGKYMFRLNNSSLELSTLTISTATVGDESNSEYIPAIYDANMTDFHSLSSVILEYTVTESSYKILTVDVGQHTEEVTITLYNPMMYSKPDNLSEFEFEKYDHKLLALDKNHVYNYLYQPSEDKKIDNPLVATTFFNPNHIYYNYVISQLVFKNVYTDLKVAGIK